MTCRGLQTLLALEAVPREAIDRTLVRGPREQDRLSVRRTICISDRHQNTPAPFTRFLRPFPNDHGCLVVCQLSYISAVAAQNSPSRR